MPKNDQKSINIQKIQKSEIHQKAKKTKKITQKDQKTRKFMIKRRQFHYERVFSVTKPPPKLKRLGKKVKPV